MSYQIYVRGKAVSTAMSEIQALAGRDILLRAKGYFPSEVELKPVAPICLDERTN